MRQDGGSGGLSSQVYNSQRKGLAVSHGASAPVFCGFLIRGIYSQPSSLLLLVLYYLYGYALWYLNYALRRGPEEG